MELILVRHGETIANVEHIYQGQTHGELTKRGVAQAFELKERLLGQNIDIVFSSDLKRAVDTAEIIVGERAIEVVYDKRLRERYLAELQGRHIDDNSKFCNTVAATVADSGSVNADVFIGDMGVESIEDMFTRVSSFIDDISNISKAKGYKNILVVSHGITINVFKAISLGEGKEELMGYATTGNCSVQVMEFSSMC